MSEGVLSLDDLQSSDNGDSTDTQNDEDELESLVETLGADLAHADEYIAEHGNRSDIIELAKALRDDDGELWELLEQYRAMNGRHRINTKYLRSFNGKFSAWSENFYGDSESDDKDTYNGIQNAVESHDVANLMLYKALFPEPVAEYYPGTPVCWQEFSEIGYTESAEQDTNIYVPQAFCENFADYTIEVDGKERPRPPTDDEVADAQGSSSSESSDVDAPIEPSVYTIAELETKLENGTFTPEEIRAIEKLEARGKDRKGANDALSTAYVAAKESESEGNKQSSGGSSDSDESEESRGDTGAATAGEVNKMGEEGHDLDPEKVRELHDDGWTKEEIIEFFG